MIIELHDPGAMTVVLHDTGGPMTVAPVALGAMVIVLHDTGAMTVVLHDTSTDSCT
jgi:hypothetical protein